MKARRWVGAVLFFLLTAVLIYGAGRLLEGDNVYPETTATRQADGCDVIFVGTSHGDMAVDPIAIFQHNGIAAYNFAASGQYIGITRMALEEILARQTPQVVVIDYQCLFPVSSQALRAEFNVRFSLRQLASPLRRAEAFRTWVGQDWLYAIPLFRYHGAWEPTDTPDVRYEYRMGWRISDGVTPFDALPAPEPEEPLPLIEPEQTYLHEMLALCERHGARAVLLNYPEYVAGDGLERAMATYADVGGFAFWDGNAYLEEIGLDPATDFYDGNHLNRFGAGKLSLWLADQLRAEFDLPDRRGNPAYEAWNLTQ